VSVEWVLRDIAMKTILIAALLIASQAQSNQDSSYIEQQSTMLKNKVLKKLTPPIMLFLKGEPLTMWDWGIYRIQLKLEEKKLPGRGRYKLSSHDGWSGMPFVFERFDKIRISETLVNVKVDGTHGREYCQMAISDLRRYFGITEIDYDQRRPWRNDHTFVRLFAHSGGSYYPDHRPNWKSELEELVVLEAEVYTKNKIDLPYSVVAEYKNQRKFVREGPLVSGRKIIFTEVE
jgi:hypothetical protein